MKKLLLILLIILLLALLGFGIFYFLGNGKNKVADFFGDNTFGTFFDTQTQSQNDLPIINTNNTLPDTTPSSQEYIAPVLRQISFEPISGYTFYSTTSTSTKDTVNEEGLSSTKEIAATSTVIRFQERATGHIYDVFEFLPAPQKISNITVQKIYSTIFSKNKDSFIYQTLSFNNEQIQTSFAKLVFSTSTEVQLSQNQISSTVNDFIFNSDANKLVFSVKQNNTSSIYTSDMDRTKEKPVTTLSFNEFIFDSINQNEVLITTKASRDIPGYAYTLNLTTGSLNKILGNINGLLVKVSPDKKYYIYSQSEYSRPSVRIYNTETKTTNIITIDTLPSEKCVFSQKNKDEAYCFGSLIYKPSTYPDDWYKGKITNYESLYKINLTNNFTQALYSFEEGELSFDVTNPKLTTKDNFIVFENKNDFTLWSIDLERLVNQF